MWVSAGLACGVVALCSKVSPKAMPALGSFHDTGIYLGLPESLYLLQ